MVNYMINWKSPREKRFSPCTAFFSYLSRRLSIWLADAHLPKHFSANEEKETKRKMATTHNSQLNKWLLAYRNKRKKKMLYRFYHIYFQNFWVIRFIHFIKKRTSSSIFFSSTITIAIYITLAYECVLEQTSREPQRSLLHFYSENSDKWSKPHEFQFLHEKQKKWDCVNIRWILVDSCSCALLSHTFDA